jgi:hypothetical protein
MLHEDDRTYRPPRIALVRAGATRSKSCHLDVRISFVTKRGVIDWKAVRNVSADFDPFMKCRSKDAVL